MNSIQKLVERPGVQAPPPRASSAPDLELSAGTIEVVPVRALLLGERLDTRALERNESLGMFAPSRRCAPLKGTAIN